MLLIKGPELKKSFSSNIMVSAYKTAWCHNPQGHNLKHGDQCFRCVIHEMLIVKEQLCNNSTIYTVNFQLKATYQFSIFYETEKGSNTDSF
jgi:hypothetical protein